MIVGISSTRAAIILARTRGAGRTFVVTGIQVIPFEVQSGVDLANLLQHLVVLWRSKRKSSTPIIALLKCSSGRFGSCLEAIKGEAMVELAAIQCGLRVIKIPPQSLKKAIGCRVDQKWRERADELFNPDGKRRYWSRGAAGAAAAAFKVAGERRDFALEDV